MKQSSTTESYLDLKKPFDATNIKGQRDKFPKSKRILSQFPKESKISNEDLMEAVVGLVALTGVVLFLCVITLIKDYRNEKELPEVEPIPIVQESVSVIEAKTELPVIKEPVLTDEEIMAKVVHIEAKGERLIGQVAVAYTILNRCDYYNKTVESVVFEPNQYSYDPHIKPNKSCYRAVIIAKLIKDFIPDLFPNTMMWFKPDSYHTDKHCGVPYIQIGNHYFNYLPSEN